MHTAYQTIATTDTVHPGVAAGVALGNLVIGGLLLLLIFAASWKLFTKAGKPGWAAIVPIYNVLVLLEIVGRPAWWIVLLFIPIANIYVNIMIALGLAKSFGRSPVFGIVGLFLFSPIGYAMLAFGHSTYLGPNGGGATGAPATVPVGPSPNPAVSPAPASFVGGVTPGAIGAPSANPAAPTPGAVAVPVASPTPQPTVAPDPVTTASPSSSVATPPVTPNGPVSPAPATPAVSTGTTPDSTNSDTDQASPPAPPSV